jgi:hypothetical protein
MAIKTVKTKVTLDDQPLAFINSRPPEARRAIRAALRAVERGDREPEPLEERLEGFFKLKVGSYRLVLEARPSVSGPAFRVLFAEKRSVVYVVFAQLQGLG